MDYLKLIREKAFRPIRSAYVDSPQFTYNVEFEDGEKIRKKDDVGLRMFLSTIQNLEYESQLGKNMDHFITSPLGYFTLIGFRSGDAIVFRDAKNRVLPILFS